MSRNFGFHPKPDDPGRSTHALAIALAWAIIVMIFALAVHHV